MSRVVNVGYLHFKDSGHVLMDCLSLTDDDGMGLTMNDFAALNGQYVLLTAEIIDVSESAAKKAKALAE